MTCRWLDLLRFWSWLADQVPTAKEFSDLSDANKAALATLLRADADAIRAALMPTEDERADVVERYGLAEGERESIAAELAERAQRIASDEILAWAKQYNARRTRAPTSTAEHRHASQNGTSAMTADWAHSTAASAPRTNNPNETCCTRSRTPSTTNGRQAGRRLLSSARRWPNCASASTRSKLSDRQRRCIRCARSSAAIDRRCGRIGGCAHRHASPRVTRFIVASNLILSCAFVSCLGSRPSALRISFRSCAGRAISSAALVVPLAVRR